jgi:hypothetical protein
MREGDTAPLSGATMYRSLSAHVEEASGLVARLVTVDISKAFLLSA